VAASPPALRSHFAKLSPSWPRSPRRPDLSALRVLKCEVRDEYHQTNASLRGPDCGDPCAVQNTRTKHVVLIDHHDLACSAGPAASRSRRRGPARRPPVVDQPRAPQLDAAGHAAADGAESGAGHSADDDQL